MWGGRTFIQIPLVGRFLVDVEGQISSIYSSSASDWFQDF